MALFFRQFVAIMASNITIAHRKHFFWKLLAIKLLLFLVMLLQTYLSKYSATNLVYFTQLEDVLVIVLNCQFVVMQYIESRDRFLDFQKACGLNIYVYVLTWFCYSLCFGLLEMIVYCGLLTAYLQYLITNDNVLVVDLK